jgi:hypothetical protein
MANNVLDHKGIAFFHSFDPDEKEQCFLLTTILGNCYHCRLFCAMMMAIMFTKDARFNDLKKEN